MHAHEQTQAMAVQAEQQQLMHEHLTRQWPRAPTQPSREPTHRP